MLRLTSTYAIASALVSTCATASDASGNLRGGMHTDTVPADIVDPVDDMTFMDPFEGFNWEQVVPIDDEQAQDSAKVLNGNTEEAAAEDPHSSIAEMIGAAVAEAVANFLDDEDGQDESHDSEDGGAVPAVEARIVGGSLVSPNDYKPWMAMTLEEKNGEHFRGVCGASMITPKWAVTAAHCISNFKDNDLLYKMDYLYVGAFRPWEEVNGKSNAGKPYQKIKIKQVYEHSGHSPGTAKPHDIALLELDDPATFSGFKSLPLPSFSPDSIDANRRATVYGFGQTTYGGSKTDELREVDVGYVTHDVCDDAMDSWTITDDMICFAAPNKDACGGDSGGPIVMNGALVGAVSWGYKCAEEGYPGIYSSTYEHRSWMQGIMGGDWNAVRFVSSEGDSVTDAGNY